MALLNLVLDKVLIKTDEEFYKHLLGYLKRFKINKFFGKILEIAMVQDFIPSMPTMSLMLEALFYAKRDRRLIQSPEEKQLRLMFTGIEPARRSRQASVILAACDVLNGNVKEALDDLTATLETPIKEQDAYFLEDSPFIRYIISYINQRAEIDKDSADRLELFLTAVFEKYDKKAFPKGLRRFIDNPKPIYQANEKKKSKKEAAEGEAKEEAPAEGAKEGEAGAQS
eukprot:TRINITY_DN12221_c0_g2_i7.p1 TRINITY_DN12221_c0_g2~~TRINITY_DN12221_c0_g2_i7.p1  ORF type:complete len:227 (+),score=85.86 TRINITY_DN12221_c0_g2_i7:94-774(+)